MGETKNLYNPHDGLTGRDGGPYLDDQERRLAEVVRAAKEDREPDFEKAPATAGTPLVTAAELVAAANPASNPSQMGSDPYALAVDSLAADESFPVNAFAERVKTDDEVAAEKAAGENSLLTNPANPTVISRDEPFVDENREEVKGLEPSKETAKAPAKKAAAKTTTKKAAAKPAAK